MSKYFRVINKANELLKKVCSIPHLGKFTCSLDVHSKPLRFGNNVPHIPNLCPISLLFSCLAPVHTTKVLVWTRQITQLICISSTHLIPNGHVW